METRRLRSLIEIIDAGSLSRAAVTLGIAQPALSYQLAEMERQFGAQLVVRGHQGVVATPAGMTLYRHAQLILGQLEQAKNEVVKQSAEISGAVTIGMVVSATPIVLVPLLAEARRKYPQINISVTEGMSGFLGGMVGKRAVDFGILSGDIQIKGIHATPLLVEPLFLVSSTGFPAPSANDIVDFDEISDLPLVVPSEANNFRRYLDSVFAARGVSLNVAAEVDSFQGLAAAAGANIGCAVLPASALVGSRQMLRMQRIRNPSLERIISLCFADQIPMLPPAIALHELLEEVVKGLVATGAWPEARLCG